ncbi:NlpC/P60 family protein [Curtobacterium sp. MCBD17_040]|uniref:C40 family peptidase n=1 Tax=Curtobacterium sp. MCBD17_040 TaxID=2175674 RepID=UPI0011B6B4F5|nr:NlpC/P60 family protein [Curtobacterium sp. MCBD17_040]WIB65295.1 NlpC/P60 family protein [Curtobacterium sp. MCBD17_040]
MPHRTMLRLACSAATLAAVTAPLFLPAAASAAPVAAPSPTALTVRLNQLQNTAAQTGAHEQEAGEAYAEAVSKQHAAQARVAELRTTVRRDIRTANTSTRRAAALAVQLSRTGTGNLTASLLTDDATASDTLDRLSTLSQLSAQSAAVLAQAETDRRTAHAAAAEAAAAATTLTKATNTARASLEAATTAATTANRQLSSIQQQQTALLTQLAAAQHRTVTTVTATWDQQQADRAEEALPTPSRTRTNSTSRTRVGTDTTTPRLTPSRTASAPPTKAAPAPTPVKPAPSPTPVNPAPSPTPVKPAPTPTPVKKAPSPMPPAATSATVQRVLTFARAQIGKRYVFGAAGPNTYDCSGLVQASYTSVGIATGPHNVVSQYQHFAAVGRLVPLADRKPGDILFYSSNGTVTGGYHDTIYTGTGRMVEAANPTVGVVERAIWLPNQLLPYVARPSGSI